MPRRPCHPRPPPEWPPDPFRVRRGPTSRVSVDYLVIGGWSRIMGHEATSIRSGVHRRSAGHSKPASAAARRSPSGAPRSFWPVPRANDRPRSPHGSGAPSGPSTIPSTPSRRRGRAAWPRRSAAPRTCSRSSTRPRPTRSGDSPPVPAAVRQGTKYLDAGPAGRRDLRAEADPPAAVPRGRPPGGQAARARVCTFRDLLTPECGKLRGLGRSIPIKPIKGHTNMVACPRPHTLRERRGSAGEVTTRGSRRGGHGRPAYGLGSRAGDELHERRPGLAADG